MKWLSKTFTLLKKMEKKCLHIIDISRWLWNIKAMYIWHIDKIDENEIHPYNQDKGSEWHEVDHYNDTTVMEFLPLSYDIRISLQCIENVVTHKRDILVVSLSHIA